MAFSIQKKIHKKQCRDCINLGTLVQNNSVPSQSHHGVQESYYDYDIFGSPITGDYTTGTDYGYLGKPYDSITGLYNYGYRDYSPQTVRFTTVDPIRDGSNWFAYVNNDPVNYVDLWGLLASDGGRTVPNTWRDNKDGTYTALPGATLYELYGENWREESGYVGNPSNLQVGDVVGRKSSFTENNINQSHQNTSPVSQTITSQQEVIKTYSWGFKTALIIGLGGEIGIIEDNDSVSLYITGSYGVGIQVSSSSKSDLVDVLKKGQGVSATIGYDDSNSNQDNKIFTTSSTTVDIGAGVSVTYDLNNLNDTGMPNSFSAGIVGGGVWYNNTTVIHLYKKGRK